MLTLAEIAKTLEVQYSGPANRVLQRVAALDKADTQSLSFFSGAARYRSWLGKTQAGAVIVAPSDIAACNTAVLVSNDPYAAYARASVLLHPWPQIEPGIHPTAHVDEGAVLAPGVQLQAHAVVGAGSRVGANCFIGVGACIGRGVTIGANTVIQAKVVVGDDCVLGEAIRIQPGAVIGSDGFGYAASTQGWIPVRQIGRVVIHDRVQIGANTTIDRGAIDDTVIESGVVIDNLVHIAHNVRIGTDTAIAGCVGIAGSAVIGKRCTIGGGAGILGHLEIVDDVHITATSFVVRSVLKPGRYSSGVPVEENKSWRRNSLRFKQLDRMAHRLAELEKKCNR